MEKGIERIEIDKRVPGLVEYSPEKFIDLYYSVRSSFTYDYEAYEHVEKILLDNLGIRRYKHFRSFMVTKNNFVK